MQKLSEYLDSLIDSFDVKIQSKSDKLSYWIEDWTKFLSFEPDFNSESLRRYKRGEEIKLHLGYNVGSEEGGLHYAVVLDKNNSVKSPVITIVPLTSITVKLLTEQIDMLNKLSENISDDATPYLSDYASEIKKVNEELDLIDKMRSELLKMKSGSIALIGQIRTVSKIRIYDPRTNHDVLSNIKISNDKLDLIDSKIIELFTKQL